jgi:hypothetical protein
MFLDPRGSHRCYNVKDAFGVVPRKFRPCFWDNTEAKQDRPSRISLFNPYAPTNPEDETDSGDDTTEEISDDGDEEEDDGDEVEDDSDEEEDDGDEEEADNDGSDSATNNPAPDPSVITEDSSSQTLGHSHEATDGSNSDEMHDTDNGGLFVADLDAAVAAATQTIAIPGGGEANIDIHNVQNLQALVQGEGDEDEDDSGEDEEDIYDVHEIFDQIGGMPRPRRPRKKAYCDIQDHGQWDGETYQSPAVIITKEEIYLVQPFSPAASPSPSPLPEPIIVMRNPVYPPNTQMPNHDRHCYFAQIPELGVFIVASPHGRCSIFSFTQITKQDGENGMKVVYGFKQDHVLPTVEQEASADWATMQCGQLMGIAVGPVQGMLDKIADPNDDDDNHHRQEELKNRRWRLMMLYKDHTVLSYELSVERTDAEPTLATLVV